MTRNSTICFLYAFCNLISLGQTCTNIGNGLGNVTNTAVSDLEYFQSKLYACGVFENTPLINGVNSISRLNNGEWESLGGQVTLMGTYNSIADMEIFGDSLALCGHFDAVDGNFSEAVMFYDGTQFMPFVSNSQDIFVPYSMAGLRNINDTIFCFGTYKVGPGLTLWPNTVGYLNGSLEWVSLGNPLSSSIIDLVQYQSVYYVATNDGLFKYVGSDWVEIGTNILYLSDLIVHHDTLFTIAGSSGNQPFHYTTDHVNFPYYSAFDIEHGKFFQRNDDLFAITKRLEDDLFHIYKWNGTGFNLNFQLSVPNTATFPFRIDDYMEINDTAYLCGDWTINGTYSVAMCDYYSIMPTAENLNTIPKLYPNPANDQIFLDADINLSGLTYKIINSSGETVLTGVFDSVTNESINVSTLVSGEYIIVTSDFHSKKFQIVRL